MRLQVLHKLVNQLLMFVISEWKVVSWVEDVTRPLDTSVRNLEAVLRCRDQVFQTTPKKPNSIVSPANVAVQLSDWSDHSWEKTMLTLIRSLHPLMTLSRVMTGERAVHGPQLDPGHLHQLFKERIISA